MYSRIISDLEKASVLVKELHGPGAVAVTLAAGRIAALAFSKDEPNLLWTHPDLGDAALVRANGLVGGIGGDRLWFSPELRYHWVGKPDWRGLGNYKYQRTPIRVAIDLSTRSRAWWHWRPRDDFRYRVSMSRSLSA